MLTSAIFKPMLTLYLTRSLQHLVRNNRLTINALVYTVMNKIFIVITLFHRYAHKECSYNKLMAVASHLCIIF